MKKIKKEDKIEKKEKRIKKDNVDVVEANIKIVEEKIKEAGREIEKEILVNVPNSLTILRLILAFVFVYMLFENFNKISLFVIFFIAAITDWFDGYFARKLNQGTKFGARLDQIIDRFFTIIIVLSLIIYLLNNRSYPYGNFFDFSPSNIYLLLFLTTSREIIGAPGFLIALIRKKGTYHVKYIGKITTFIQSVTLGVIILDLNWSIYLAMATCIIGIFSGFDYLKYSLS
jgi:CDP-diacylglycerol--glycerol-3-phosphate 3-phosphatidyltransferase